MKLHDLAVVSAIPKNSAVAKKTHTPWWNDECQGACTKYKKGTHIIQTSTIKRKFKQIQIFIRQSKINNKRK